MYVIIVGGGQIGYNLAKTLLQEGHEILILEKDPKKCASINEELGSVAMRGDGCEAATLEEAGAARADMLIAVTGDDEDNLVACQVAKHRFHVARTIAKVKNPRHQALFYKLGVDLTVSATDLILAHIEQEIPSHPLVPLVTLRRSGLELVEVRITPQSAAIGKRLRDIALPPDSVVCLVVGRNKTPNLPSSDTVLEVEDMLVCLIRPEAEGALNEALTGKKVPAKK